MIDPRYPNMRLCDRCQNCSTTDHDGKTDWTCGNCRHAIAEAEQAQRNLEAACKVALADLRRAEWLQVFCAALPSYLALDTQTAKQIEWSAQIADEALELADTRFPPRSLP